MLRGLAQTVLGGRLRVHCTFRGPSPVAAAPLLTSPTPPPCAARPSIRGPLPVNLACCRRPAPSPTPGAEH
eukprot:8149005-Pyramimonas_sp.AAC.2